MNCIDNPDLYDQILLGGQPSPGRVTISNHARAQTWDIKDAKGSTGATTTYQGDKIAQFTCSFYLSDQDDMAAWDDFLPVVLSMTQGKTIKAIDIFHPYLCELYIVSVSQAKITGRVADGKGGETVTVDFLEYKPPKPKGGSTTAATSGKDWKNAKADPNAKAKAELDALLAAAKAA